MQQRYGLRNSQITGLRASESSESTFSCHPSGNHYLPRPSRWSWTYACIAASKGFITRASTRWLGIQQQFSELSAKKPNGKEKGGCWQRCCSSLCSEPSHRMGRVERRGRFVKQQRDGLQARPSATLTRIAARGAEADETDAMVSTPVSPSGRVVLP
jgi:hypothetical protein